jgi:hypothetical protein
MMVLVHHGCSTYIDMPRNMIHSTHRRFIKSRRLARREVREIEIVIGIDKPHDN